MKYLKAISFLISIACLMSLSECQKEDPPPPKTELEKLPPATQLGKYTFGCLVNGIAMVPDNTLDVSAIYQSNWLQILGRVEDNNGRQSLNFFIDKVNISEGLYVLNDPLKSNAGYRFSNDKIRCEYKTDGALYNLGELVITKFDRVSLIVSGTFKLTLTTNGCDKIEITEGRFDLKYIP